MTHSLRVCVRGPLAPYRDGLCEDLLERGYSPATAKIHLLLASHLSAWLEAEALSPSALTRAQIDAFLAHRRQRGITWRLSPRGLEPILLYLRSRGVVPAPEPPSIDDSPQARLLSEFETYLLKERGVTASTMSSYLRVSSRFLTGLAEVSHSNLHDLTSLSLLMVSQFLLRVARDSSVRQAKLAVTALRLFLGYLHVRGYCGDLSGALPAVVGYRLSGLPKALGDDEIRRLLEGCDPKTATGCRDLAILLLLSRLGLRACEVAQLEVGDVRWAVGEVQVRGKGSEGRLPVPYDVGEAVARYLRDGRPRSTSPRIFLQACAPFHELRPNTVVKIVRRAAARVGLPPIAAHRLRHTAGTMMLRKGASLAEIAHVLRHRCIDTTAIYAKVDHLALRALARRWPGGVR